MLRIRLATLDDAPDCLRIARAYPKALPDMRLFHFVEAANQTVKNRRLYVADFLGQLAGFVRWNATTRGQNAGYNVIYDLAVEFGLWTMGIGRALLYSVPAPIRLKCTQDNEQANRFYQHAGMTLIGTETGKRRALNVWGLKTLCILCAGKNKRFPEIARASGMAYGTRHDHTPHDQPFMIDINWQAYRWGDYLRKLMRHRPVMAMVPDYEHPDQLPALLNQIEQVEACGVLRVMVCPKFDGALADIPARCVVALSVPSQYAGYIPPLEDMRLLRGRCVHLLGGSPRDQFALMREVEGYGGTVISLDGSSHQSAANFSSVWDNGRWNRPRDGSRPHGDVYQTMTISGRNIVREANKQAEMLQLPLLS